MCYQLEFKDFYDWPNLEIALKSHISLKFFIDFVRRHVGANMIATHFIFNKKNYKYIKLEFF
jgi:hypothetical protein